MHIKALIRVGSLGLGLSVALGGAVMAGEYNLSIDRVVIDTGEFTRTGIGFNGSSPGPLLRFKEGEDVTINVKNNLDEPSSIHWHGMILAYQQDGVPGLSFEGIAPGATHTYRFPISQTGTYWYHSHSGFQEPDGAYGAIVIDPKGREPFRYDRDYVVQFTDAHRHQGSRIFRNLKTMPDYYNRQQRTLVDLVRDATEDGLGEALSDRFMWGSMRMMPTDIEDVPGTTPLINGEGPEENWTGLFNPGERVRLRFINSSAMTYFDIRIPGLEMTVVQADGQNVQPVKVDELRIAVAETYDVIVRPTEDRAYTIFAETMGRSAYARGTLAPRPGIEAEIPEMRERNLLTMADMGMDHGAMGGMDHGAMGGMSGGHTMPDGTVMQGGMGGAATHTMPDGTVMKGGMGGTATQGASDAGTSFGATDSWTHTMPGGATMQGPAHGGMDHGPTGGGAHTMPDGSMMQGPAHGGNSGGLRKMRGSTSMHRPARRGMEHGFLGGAIAESLVVQASWHGGVDQQPASGWTHTMPDGSTMQGPAHGGGLADGAASGSHTMPDGTVMQGGAHGGMDHGAMGGGAHTMPDGTMMQGGAQGGMDHAAMGHGSSPGGDPFYAPGSGLTPAAANGGRVLSYADLKAIKPLYPDREPTREIELRLTGNMERYIWSINGVKFEDSEPIRLRYGERVRFKLVNETMMTHPMHLHGMWSILDNGNGQFNPAKHVVSVAPGTTVTMETEVDAEGVWAFHCHLAYHMDAGMMRKVIVEGGPLGFKESDAAGFGPVHNVITEPDYVTGTGS